MVNGDVIPLGNTMIGFLPTKCDFHCLDDEEEEEDDLEEEDDFIMVFFFELDD